MYGGSFGQAFAGGLVRDAAAVAANAVGVTAPGIGAAGSSPESILANVAGHALVGCAAQSLMGGDCAGGAIGGAASAVAAPLIRDAVYADSPLLNYSDDRVRQALTVGLATLVGGLAGAALGTDVTSATLAAQNESLNNATSQGPARGIAARENARLTKLCEPNCTKEDFVNIDKQVRQVEAAATLARLNNLTPEQTLKLGDMLTSLLPLYGSPAALYQAVTGQGLSGQPLGTAERWLMGIAAAIPAGSVIYGKLTDLITAKGSVGVAARLEGKSIGNLDIGNPTSVSLPRSGERLVLNQGNLPTCGPTSCAMVLDTAGKSFDLGELIVQSGVTASGTTMPKLASVLNGNGLAAQRVLSATIGDLAAATAAGNPAIVRMTLERGGHAVVVDGVTMRAWPGGCRNS